MFPSSFTPAAGKTVNIDASAVTQRIALPGVNPGASQVLLTNSGSATVWFEFGDVTVEAAVATGVPILAGAAHVFTFPRQLGAPYLAVIGTGPTGKFYSTTGLGL